MINIGGFVHPRLHVSIFCSAFDIQFHPAFLVVHQDILLFQTQSSPYIPAMFRYGKLARQAVAAMSYLAERYAPDAPTISSSEVGRVRKIPPALAAKLLSEAASAGLTRGTTGPGGGYRLARPPEEIRLAEIVGIFEREMDEYPCPFGPGWCGIGNPCPLHADFLKLEENGRRFLEETTLAVFMRRPLPDA